MATPRIFPPLESAPVSLASLAHKRACCDSSILTCLVVSTFTISRKSHPHLFGRSINAISLFLSLPPLSISISRSKWIISIKRKKANTPEQNLAQPTIKVDQATTSISSNLSDNLKALITLSCFIFTKNCVSTYRN